MMDVSFKIFGSKFQAFLLAFSKNSSSSHLFKILEKELKHAAQSGAQFGTQNQGFFIN